MCDQSKNEKFMRMAIELADKGMTSNCGGPFGSVIVDKDGKIVGKGHNTVLRDNDPTAHGEVVAIRDACKNKESFDLSGHTLYTNAIPCPMCMSAIMWARIEKVYYALSLEEASKIGFDDEKFYEELNKPLEKREIPVINMKELEKESLVTFEKWAKKEDKVPY